MYILNLSTIMNKLTKEDIENYQKVRKILNEFCDRFITRLYLTDDRLCYPKYTTGDFFIVGNILYINTLKDYSDCDNNYYVEVPLSVFYEDTMEEYINKLHEEKLKKDEEEKSRFTNRIDKLL